MALKFGTSGIRGLNTEFTPAIVNAYITAFIEYAKTKTPFTEIALGGDLRESTPGIQRMVEEALSGLNYKALDCGRLPTPALALYCAHKNIPGVMITGSHIPGDRNGIKFYWPWGEILKDDEHEINKGFERIYSAVNDPSLLEGKVSIEAREQYIERYVSFFKPYKELFSHKKIIVYQHSTVSRDLWKPICSSLGLEVLEVGRSTIFTPVDTETDEAAKNLRALIDLNKIGSIYAVVSSDGDADRPFLCDENLNMIRGDTIGILSAAFLNVDCVVTPVSTNTALEKAGIAKSVVRTKIGSPYVIDGMKQVKSAGVVLGFEANGGVLLGTKVIREGVSIDPLPTRDSILPVLCCLALAAEKSVRLSELVRLLPARFTDSDVVRGVPIEKKSEIYKEALEGTSFQTRFIAKYGSLIDQNEMDGLRLTFANGSILHFRPSGNAPEFRCYAEADTAVIAKAMVAEGLNWLKSIC